MSATRKYISIATLVLITGGALTLAGVFFFGGKKNDPYAANAVHWFKCFNCGKVFSLTREQELQQVPDPAVLKKYPIRGRFLRNCPFCKHKSCAAPMVRCPKCGKLYVPARFDLRKPYDPNAKDICPFCGTDRAAWYKAHRSHPR